MGWSNINLYSKIPWRDKLVYPIYLIPFFFLLNSFQVVYGQPCDGNPPPAQTVNEVQLLCEGLDALNEYCFWLQPNNCDTSAFPGGCNPIDYVLDNPNWFGFVAGTSNVSLEINIDSCQNTVGAIGAQFALYEAVGDIGTTPECDPYLLPLDVVSHGTLPECNCVTGQRIYNGIPTTIGSTYYLVFDGCAGDSCQIRISVIAGGEPPPIPGATDIIFPLAGFATPAAGHLDTICAGAEGVIIETNVIPNTSSYLWTLPGGTDFITTNPQIVYNFPITPGATFDFCVRGRNDCDTSNFMYCETVILAALDTLFDPPIFLCEGETTTWMGMTVGPYNNLTEDIVDMMGVNIPDPTTFNCNVANVVEIFVTNENDEAPTIIDTVICGQNYISVFGQEISSSVQNSIFVSFGGSAAGCDTTVDASVAYLDADLTFNSADASCSGGMITVCPDTEMYMPDSATPGLQISYRWIRTSDGMQVGDTTACLEIGTADFNNPTETFELSIVLSLNNRPVPPCSFGPFSVTLNAADFVLPAGDVSGPDTLCVGTEATYIFTSTAGSAEATWSTAPLSATIIQETGQLYRLSFNSAGNAQVCAAPTNACGVEPPACVDVYVIAPFVQGIESYTCNGSQDSFFVRIPLIGGQEPFSIISGEGSISNDTFVSNLVPSGELVLATIADAAGCEVPIFANAFICDCITDAGTMSTATLEICGDLCIQAVSNLDTMMDANDIAEFILHDQPGSAVNNIIARNNSGLFCFTDTSLNYDETYYVSLVVGDAGFGMDTVDLSADCSRIAPGQPVIWHEIPRAMARDTITCADIVGLTAVPSVGQGTWSISSITDKLSINDATLPNATLYTDSCGTYNLQWSENNSGCLDSTTIQISFHCTASVTSQQLACNTAQTGFDLEIILSGGTAPFMEENGRGSFSDSLFTEMDISLNTRDTFIFIDNNGCRLLHIITTTDCNCLSIIGEMGIPVVQGCQQDTLRVFYDGENEIREPGDTILFFIHDRMDDTLGNIAGTSSDTAILFSEGNFECDSIYYVSAVIGSWNGVTINLNDPCLQVSTGQPVRFHCQPTVFAGNDTSICTLQTILSGQSTNGAGIWTTSHADVTLSPIDAVTSSALFNTPGRYMFQFISSSTMCISRDTIVVTVVDAPQVVPVTVDTVCLSSGEYYTVSFTIQGGDENTYTVNGNPITGNIFLSDSIPSGEPFEFIVSDTNICFPDTISGSFTCACFSSIGELSQGPFYYCAADTVSAATFYNPAGQVIVGNDIRNYILFSDRNDIVGSALYTNVSGDFVFESSTMNLGRPYYVVLVIGNQIIPDVVDLTDRCLLVSDTLEIVWYNKIDFAIGNDGREINCNQPEINLFISTLDDTSGYAIQWQGENGAVILPTDSSSYELLVTQPGRYIATIGHPNADCDTSLFIDITRSPDLPEAIILEPDTLTCRNTEITLFGSNSTSGPSISYQWSGPGILSNDTAINILINVSGRYTLTVIDRADNCEVSTSVLVGQNIIPPLAVASVLDIFDCDTETVSLSGNGSSVGLFISYSWISPDTGNIVGSPTLRDIEVDEDGLYSIFVTNEENGCFTMSSVLVETDENIVSGLELEIEQPACDGIGDGEIEIENVIGGIPFYEYSFDGGETFSAVSERNNLSPGVYVIGVRDQNNCEYFDTVQLFEPYEFYVDLGPDIFSPLGDELILLADTDLPDSLRSLITWNPLYDTINSQSVQQELNLPIGSYQIAVSITDRTGCVESDDVTVFITFEERIFIPTAIRSESVNLENRYINIYADPIMVESISNFEIYDRWGERVFQRSAVPVSLDFDANYAWDGMIDGQPALPGVYAFVARVSFADGLTEVLKGDITVVR